jgi:prolyl 4-hydroxylase
MKYSENDLLLYQLHVEVLDKIDCENLIKEFNEFKTARTINGDFESDRKYRKAEIAVYENESELLKKVRKIFSEKTNTSINQQETPLSIIKYEKGGEYKPHYDCYGNLKDVPNEESGDRIITGILYLNDDYLGGETEFSLENINIKGNQGDLLIWYNLNKNRTLNRRTLHAGLPVIDGVKYIIVVWIREREINKKFEKTLL